MQRKIKNLVKIVSSLFFLSTSGCFLFKALGFEQGLKMSGVCEQLYGKEECKEYNESHIGSYTDMCEYYYLARCPPDNPNVNIYRFPTREACLNDRNFHSLRNQGCRVGNCVYELEPCH